MKPILHARVESCDHRALTLACDNAATMRIAALQPDLVRVTLLRNDRLRQHRTWSVPAYGQSDTPWAGRDRLDDSSWPAVPVEIKATDDEVVLATEALRLTITLRGLRMDWALPDATVFARDRAVDRKSTRLNSSHI